MSPVFLVFFWLSIIFICISFVIQLFSIYVEDYRERPSDVIHNFSKSSRLKFIVAHIPFFWVYLMFESMLLGIKSTYNNAKTNELRVNIELKEELERRLNKKSHEFDILIKRIEAVEKLLKAYEEIENKRIKEQVRNSNNTIDML